MIIKMILIFCILSSVWITADSKKYLKDFKYNRYSQFGEDGIIEKIFELIGAESKLCVEFGAWDGLACSNTALLWRHKKWKAILIEADKIRYAQLLKNIFSYNCIAVCKTVGIEDDNSIDAILTSLNINDPIDLMSIDIDGNDYYIFESLNLYRPRVIICERNPTIPIHLDIYQDYGGYFGCSVGALIRIGNNKDYTLIALTEANAFFVDNQLLHYFNDFELTIDRMDANKIVNYLAYSYDGRPVILSESSESLFVYGLNKKGFLGKLNNKYGVYRQIKNLILTPV